MSGLEPGLLAAIIGTGGAVASSIFGGGGGERGGSFTQGAPIQQQAMIPPGFEDAYKMAAQLAMQRMQEPQYVAPMNPLSLGGANIASQFYMGQPYQQPQLQQYRPGQGQMPNQPQIPMPGMPSPIGGAGGQPPRALGRMSRGQPAEIPAYGW